MPNAPGLKPGGVQTVDKPTIKESLAEFFASQREK